MDLYRYRITYKDGRTQEARRRAARRAPLKVQRT